MPITISASNNASNRIQVVDASRIVSPFATVNIIIEDNARTRTLVGVPEGRGHGRPTEQLIAEMTTNGFDLVRRIDDCTGDVLGGAK